MCKTELKREPTKKGCLWFFLADIKMFYVRFYTFALYVRGNDEWNFAVSLNGLYDDVKLLVVFLIVSTIITSNFIAHIN